MFTFPLGDITLEFVPNQFNYEWSVETKKEPYRCPVCNGKGLLPKGFYEQGEYFSSSDTSPEICRTCQGQGIVWG